MISDKQIMEREARNQWRLEKMRDNWNRIGAAMHSAEPEKPNIPRALVTKLSEDATLIASGHNALLKWGPLRIKLERVNETEIGRAMLRLQNHSRNWPDGTLRGMKKLIWHNGHWVSPSFGTVWTDGQCHATDFNEAGQLRGQAGIHATWPDKLDELNCYPGELVEIAGWGEVTMGDIGWRAQHALVVRRVL